MKPDSKKKNFFSAELVGTIIKSFSCPKMNQAEVVTPAPGTENSQMADSAEAPAAKKQKTTPEDNRGHILVVMGASGDLAKKSIYPALWDLFKSSRLPNNLHIVGFARSNLSVADVRERAKDFIEVGDSQEEKDLFEKFWTLNLYTPGSYDSAEKAKALTDAFEELDKKYQICDRTFYLALPPAVYQSVTDLIKKNWMTKTGRTKIAIEKPFGTDLESSNALDKHLMDRFKEEQICRVDHYLSLEMVQAIMAIRFTNKMFLSCWNNRSISSVMITFKEDFGTMGRGGYFDKSGIIRDVMQNHMLQILALIAMEKPETYSDIENVGIGVNGLRKKSNFINLTVINQELLVGN